MGRGHCEYGFVVPERLKSQDFIVITTRNEDEYDLNEEEPDTEPFENLGEKLPGRYVYFYKNTVKEEVEDTYDQVA